MAKRRKTAAVTPPHLNVPITAAQRRQIKTVASELGISICELVRRLVFTHVAAEYERIRGGSQPVPTGSTPHAKTQRSNLTN